MTLGADVFVGKLVKEFRAETGFKGQLTLPDGENIYVLVKYNGKTTDFLKESVGKTVVLMGDLRFPGIDAKSKTPIIEVRGKVNDGGLVTKRGRCTKDPELAYTQNGKQYTKFTLATNYGYGEKKETDFIFCTLWGDAEREKNPAVTLAEKGSKGREMLVKGRLQMGKDKDEKLFPSLTVSDFEFIGPAPEKKGDAANSKNESDLSGWEDLGAQVNFDDDDIPF